MLFNSFSFLVFFPLTVFLYFVFPVKIKNIWLLIASYVFYMGWNPKYAFLLLFCTVITFIASLIIERIKNNFSEEKSCKIKFILILSITLILCILFYYKYLNFIINLLNSLFKFVSINTELKNYSIILPVGISFFSFQAIGYLIDVYRGDVYAERNFFKYALFVSFFPQLVAGPIERSKNLLKQLDKTYCFNFDNLKNGLLTMLYGYFLKVVIADRASLLVNFVYSNENATGIHIVFATFIFAFQIYCDFCGYSTIATGVAKVLGMNLVQNFNTPYFSTSFQDFWRRWHISLSSWFRDYLYIPLGGSRKGRFRKNINVLIVMLISGLWHGAGLNYIFWGFLNGIFQIFDDLSKNIRKHISKLISIPVTFIFVCITWLFFRAENMTHAFFLIKKILLNLEPSSLVRNMKENYSIGGLQISLLLFTIFILLIVDFIRYKNISLRQWIISKHWLIQSLFIVCIILFILIFGVWGADYNPSAFIYFQF